MKPTIFQYTESIPFEALDWLDPDVRVAVEQAIENAAATALADAIRKLMKHTVRTEFVERDNPQSGVKAYHHVYTIEFPRG